MSDSIRLDNRCSTLKPGTGYIILERVPQRLCSKDTNRERERERPWTASVRWDLLRRLHTAMQYSSESKLLRLPAQPPYMKRTHFFWLMSKCQRGMEARQGPVSASRVHTAARGKLVRSSSHLGLHLLQSQPQNAKRKLLHNTPEYCCVCKYCWTNFWYMMSKT